MIPLQTDIKLIDSAIMVATLIVLNVVIFLTATGVASPEAWAQSYGLAPVIFTSWLFEGGTAPRTITFFTLLTSQFMHGGIWHLAVNAWGLWLFGRPLEDRLGAGRFLALYLLAGLTANFVHIAVYPESGVPVIGASGAIAGVIGAFVVTWPRARVLLAVPILLRTIALPAAIFAFIWIGLDLISGMFNLFYPERGGDGVAHWAHIGGFVAGLITIILLRMSAAGPVQIGELRESQLNVGPPLGGRQRPRASAPALETAPSSANQPAAWKPSNFLDREDSTPALVEDVADVVDSAPGPWGRKGLDRP